MKITKMQILSIFYEVEDCEACGCDHTIHEGDVHPIINSDHKVFICPIENVCVEVRNV